MSNPWKQLFDEISDPWDLAAACGGGAVGLWGSLSTAGADGGTMTAGGALAGIAARRSCKAALRKPALIRRAKKLIRRIERSPDDNQSKELLLLKRQIEESVDLFEDGIKTMPDFATDLETFIDRYEELIRTESNKRMESND